MAASTSVTGPGSEPAVVVGFDGSEGSRQAALWAAAEALTRRRTLLLVAAFETPMSALPTTRSVPPVNDPRTAELLRRHLQDQLDTMAEQCRQAAPELAVRATVVDGPSVQVLRSAAAGADVLVVGSTGLTGLARLLLGSTAAELAGTCDAPVIVVRGDSPGGAAPRPATGGHIVVGVDGSPASSRATGFAYDFAQRHGCTLLAVHTWEQPAEMVLGTWTAEVDADRLRDGAEALVTQELAGWQQRHPTVPTRHHVEPGPPANALIQQAAGATLLVVGSRGHGVVRRTLFGSVSHAVVYHAPCPVAVVGEPQST